MGRLIDLTGRRFGRLVVLSKADSVKTKYGATQARWNCKCDCGNEIIAKASLLMNGNVKSCGCLKHNNPARFHDLTGQKFGRLTVIEFVGKNQHNKAIHKCICDCGNITYVTTNQLVIGRTKSCGCLKIAINKEIHKTNGLSYTRIRSKWDGMMRRCYNPKIAGYQNYGGRGIKVCEEWHNLENFAKWSYENGFTEDCDLTIERIDNDGNYEPNNCRWATKEEQANNKRNNRFIEYNSERKTLAQWSKQYSIDRSKVSYRLNHGWNFEEAFEIVERKR